MYDYEIKQNLHMISTYQPGPNIGSLCLDLTFNVWLNSRVYFFTFNNSTTNYQLLGNLHIHDIEDRILPSFLWSNMTNF